MRQHLAHAFAQGACHLRGFHAEAPSILKNDIPQLLIHTLPQLGLIGVRDSNPIRIFNGNKYNQIKTLHRAPHARKPMLQVEPVRIGMRDQVRKDVRRTPVEDLVLLAVDEAVDRAFKLELEVFERRHLRKLMAFLFKKVVRLVDCHVGRESSTQLFDQCCLTGSMRS